tara:strand:+ start:1423 stop:1788 length:366 start_codon:yes stop_codon:yes gene_type:complete
VQDDVLDCYGDPETIGKIGTDIKDNKCSWLINTALSICTPAQKKTLESNYAKHDVKSEAAVKKIYKDLDLYSKFQASVTRKSEGGRAVVVRAHAHVKETRDEWHAINQSEIDPARDPGIAP